MAEKPPVGNHETLAEFFYRPHRSYATYPAYRLPAGEAWPECCYLAGVEKMPSPALSTAAPRLFSFSGGSAGPWAVTRMGPVIGEPLPVVRFLTPGTGGAGEAGARWVLRGITSNERYVTRPEKSELVAKQEGLGRPAARCAALIPIRKSAAWWNLTQDERRKIFEEQSAHIKIGLGFLPAIARRLHHCRDLGPDEPFDFLTWFEYAPADAAAFEDLTAQLRASPEWKFVSRECDIRLERIA